MSEAQPVKIVDTEKAIPVVVEHIEDKREKGSLSPTTTEQEDMTTAGQRRVNLIWEYTQAIIALVVCLFTMIAALIIVIAVVYYDKKDVQIPTIFAVAFGTVIGFYFSRTNHQAIGGEGKKPTQKYIGR